MATHAGQVVIQSGPYRLIRHPSYTGALITLLGMGLALTNWASLIAALVIPAVGFLYRISIEERVLVEALGNPYREYMQRTCRLIPFIWQNRMPYDNCHLDLAIGLTTEKPCASL